MFHVASTSALALDSSCPDGWRWCQLERQPEVLPGDLAPVLRAEVVHGDAAREASADHADDVDHDHCGQGPSDEPELPAV